MRLAAVATYRHHVDHLKDIWSLLDDDEKAGFWCSGPQARSRCQELGIRVESSQLKHGKRIDAVLAAGYQESKALHRAPAILVEHGVGQTYITEFGPHSAHPGGPGREHVVLFLNPNQRCADINRDAYPDTPSVVVGCPPLDTIPSYEPGPRPVIAVTFHWVGGVVQECESAWNHYRPAFEELFAKETGLDWLGHGHPRYWSALSGWWNELGIPSTPDFGDVLRYASALVCDNSSAMYEYAAAADRPVVVLNTPTYRRDVEHGLRFWSHANVGINVDRPRQLHDGILSALVDWVSVARRRRQISAELYPCLDGSAGERAVAAIRQL